MFHFVEFILVVVTYFDNAIPTTALYWILYGKENVSCFIHLITTQTGINPLESVLRSIRMENVVVNELQGFYRRHKNGMAITSSSSVGFSTENT